MENKKTKLTISGNPRKSFKDFNHQKNQNKKTVVIDRDKAKSPNKNFKSKTFTSKPTSNFRRSTNLKPNFSSNIPQSTGDFERRKLAEQRARKRLKGDEDEKDKKLKLGFKKREKS